MLADFFLWGGGGGGGGGGERRGLSQVFLQGGSDHSYFLNSHLIE